MNARRRHLAALLVVGVLLLLATPLAAHSEVRTRAPEAGQVVAEVDHIDLLFFVPIASGEIILTGPDGESIDVGPTSLSNSGLITSVKFDTQSASGSYTVFHSELADDGDTQEATYGFVVDPDSDGSVATLFERDDGPNWVILGGIGGVLLILIGLFAPRRSGNAEGNNASE